MKPGTCVRLPDGRIGTIVYHGPDGYGIKWGQHAITEEDVCGSGCAIIGVEDRIPDDYQWAAEAMLREPWPGSALPCVGSEYEVLDAR